MMTMAGCANDDVVVEGDGEGVVVEDVVVEDLDDAAPPDDGAPLDNDVSVPTVEEEVDAAAEQPEQLDEDPTSFRSTPTPASHFFNPEVP